MFVLHRFLTGALLLALSPTESAIAQSFQSPEVHQDGSVTVRLKARDAERVVVSLAGRQLPMVQQDSGLWQVTSPPLPAGIHDYVFHVDGTMMIDPSNRMVKKWLTMASMVEVPGNPPLPTEMQDVPHGAIHRLWYTSDVVGRARSDHAQPAAARPVMVYTPPGYQAGTQTSYPLVLLLHGFGDDETAWTEVGRAHCIADNLIAAGELRPCVIAMPSGHPLPIPYGQRPDDYFVENNGRFEQDVMRHLLPFLETQFAVSRDAAGRSIAGLSMGGGHALDTGLRNLDTFSSIGAFSAAAPQLADDQLLTQYASLRGPAAAASSLKNLWMPIGDTDFLLERNDRFVEQLRAQGVPHVYHKVPGGHEWKLWREFLPEFLKMAVGS